MGFGLAERDSVIGMAFAQGYKQQVVNVGMDIVRIPDHVDNEEAETFIGSLMHKVCCPFVVGGVRRLMRFGWIARAGGVVANCTGVAG